MRVMHVVAPAPFGGLEQVVFTLAVGQTEVGLTVNVTTLVNVRSHEPALIQRLQQSGMAVHQIARRSRSYWSQLVALRTLCRRTLPDIVHTHGYHPDFLGAFLVDMRGGPRLVSTAHGFTGGGLRNRFYERVQQRALRRYDGVVAVSRSVAAQLAKAGCRPDRMHIVPNAWKPSEPSLPSPAARNALGISPSDFSIGWVGRILHEKGLDILLDAIAKLDGLPFRLTIVGDGVLRRHLERLTEQRGLGPRVNWVGSLPAAAPLLSAFDLLVISSRTEGTPMVLLEAMSAGVPVIATAVGGIPDVLTEADAVLVGPEDSAALADAIRTVYRDPKAGAERATRARGRVERDYATGPWIDRYNDVYFKVLAQNEASRGTSRDILSAH